MELVTLAHVRRMRQRDPDTGEFTDPKGYASLFAQHVVLFDPPGLDGVRRDGEGSPLTSYHLASQALEALEKGCIESSPDTKGTEAMPKGRPGDYRIYGRPSSGIKKPSKGGKKK